MKLLLSLNTSLNASFPASLNASFPALDISRLYLMSEKQNLMVGWNHSTFCVEVHHLRHKETCHIQVSIGKDQCCMHKNDVSSLIPEKQVFYLYHIPNKCLSIAIML